MSWNYRVVHRRFAHPDGSTEDQYGIHEVYYHGDEATSCTHDPVDPHGETLEELQSDLEYMVEALAKPVLEYEDFIRRESV